MLNWHTGRNSMKKLNRLLEGGFPLGYWDGTMESTAESEGAMLDRTGNCCACFGPIRGEPFHFRPGGRNFHEGCAMSKPKNYYVSTERRLAREEAVLGAKTTRKRELENHL